MGSSKAEAKQSGAKVDPAEVKTPAVRIIRVAGIRPGEWEQVWDQYESAQRRRGTTPLAGTLIGSAMAHVQDHGLFAAARMAYNEHRGLVLRPDDFRLAMLQGVARHVACEPEACRGALEIRHIGSEPIRVECEARPVPDAGNTVAWQATLGAFRQRILERVGGSLMPLLMVPFSTTTEADKTAAAVALMCAVQPYFRYHAMTMCGITHFTFMGVRDDWAALRNAAEALPRLGMGWWAPPLVAVLDRILRDVYDAPIQGETREAFWENAYNEQSEGSGRPDTGNGWLFALLPYRADNKRADFSVDPLELARGRVLARRQSLLCLPRSIDSVPVVWDYLGQQIHLKIAAGFGPPTRDAKALAPSVAWGVFPSAAPDSDAPSEKDSE